MDESSGVVKNCYKAVEAAIISYLGRHQNREKVSDLLLKSGLFDLLTNGIIRIKTQVPRVPEEEQSKFFRQHILLANWTREQTEQLKEEYMELTGEIAGLKEERKKLDDQFEELRHPQFPIVIQTQQQVLPAAGTMPKNAGHTNK